MNAVNLNEITYIEVMTSKSLRLKVNCNNIRFTRANSQNNEGVLFALKLIKNIRKEEIYQ